mgnify:FL=1
MKEFLNQEIFTTGLASVYKDGMSIIDTILIWCEKNKIDPEDVASFIKSDKSLLSKVKKEAQSLSLVAKDKKTSNNTLEELL